MLLMVVHIVQTVDELTVTLMWPLGDPDFSLHATVSDTISSWLISKLGNEKLSLHIKLLPSIMKYLTFYTPTAASPFCLSSLYLLFLSFQVENVLRPYTNSSQAHVPYFISCHSFHVVPKNFSSLCVCFPIFLLSCAFQRKDSSSYAIDRLSQYVFYPMTASFPHWSCFLLYQLGCVLCPGSYVLVILSCHFFYINDICCKSYHLTDTHCWHCMFLYIWTFARW